MPDHDIVVIGASAGGVEALAGLAASLPAGLPAAVLVVLHVPSIGSSALPDILSRHGPLPASHVKDGEPVEPGHIYIAPPDHHLLLRQGHMHLSRGPRENGHRPAVDPLFRSAAREYAARVVGVILSGALDDGTAGLLAIKSRGGIAVVQDPADAIYPGMPGNALEVVEVDHVVPVGAMGEVLARLAGEPAAQPPGPTPADLEVEVEVDEFSLEAMEGEHAGEPSGFSCPDCNGVLWGIDDGGMHRFRCRVGHAWSPEALLARQREALEAALWIALRSLEERAALARRLAGPARDRGHRLTAARFEEQATEAQGAARVVRELLIDRDNFAMRWPLIGDRGAPPVSEGTSG
ncbi:MAG TPA: chemotaxis protein CheB [Actinomycetes bacterium]|jgi:two-component system chemotaxis response regulator CheB